MKYQAKISQDGDGYSVEFPDLPGCFSAGDTLEQAKVNAAEALSLYLQEAQDPDWQLPEARRRKGKDLYWLEPSDEVRIALRIRSLRMRAGLNQSRFARRLGMPVQQLQKLETPGKSNPTYKMLTRIYREAGEELPF
ncbi:MAG: type II toxin-antitoxin system HicB family antitoxin [Myxococcales bacterium]|nr:MAG: type II toxin-antitoxin system HicB family antitoxin [Myxococcales bacterium]